MTVEQNNLQDGPHRFGQTKNCFFCMKDKRNCQVYRFLLTDYGKTLKEVKEYTDQGYMCCPDCYARGGDWLRQQLLQFMQVEKLAKTKFGRKPK